MAVLRFATLNFWGTAGELPHRIALFHDQATRLHPEVLGLQEVRPVDGVSGETTAHVLASKLDYHVEYAEALRWEDDVLAPGMKAGSEGLAVLSKFPILETKVTRLPEARKTEARILLSARIDGSTPFWFHTTHLHYRLDDGLAREKQIVEIDRVIREIDENPQVLCGDFNAHPGCDEIRFLRGEANVQGQRTHYQDAYGRIHPNKQGYTWSADNENTRPLRSLDIDRRIDYIFVTTRRKDGRGTILNADLAFTDRDADENCCSDHYGVYADVRITPR